MSVELLTCLCESGSLVTLEKIALFNSLNFEKDDACSLLIELIDKAVNLKDLNIGFYRGGKKIWVMM